jgi:hypothetical protein
MMTCWNRSCYLDIALRHYLFLPLCCSRHDQGRAAILDNVDNYSTERLEPLPLAEGRVEAYSG